VVYIDTTNCLQRSRLADVVKELIQTGSQQNMSTLMDNIRIVNVFSIFSLLDTLALLSRTDTEAGQGRFDLLIVDTLHALMDPHLCDSSKKSHRAATATTTTTSSTTSSSSSSTFSAVPSREKEEDNAMRLKGGGDSTYVSMEPLLSQIMIALKHLLSSFDKDGNSRPTVGAVLLTSLIELEAGSSGINTNNKRVRGESTSFWGGGRCAPYSDAVDLSVLVSSGELPPDSSNGCFILGDILVW
jgi:hypothetical protein